MSGARDNHVRRCKRLDCTRATFVETERGVSVHFRHGTEKHPDTYTVEQMIVFLAARGYVVVEAAKVLKVA